MVFLKKLWQLTLDLAYHARKVEGSLFLYSLSGNNILAIPLLNGHFVTDIRVGVPLCNGDLYFTPAALIIGCGPKVLHLGFLW